MEEILGDNKVSNQVGANNKVSDQVGATDVLVQYFPTEAPADLDANNHDDLNDASTNDDSTDTPDDTDDDDMDNALELATPDNFTAPTDDLANKAPITGVNNDDAPIAGVNDDNNTAPITGVNNNKTMLQSHQE
jgi:hypothetical protein